MSRTYRGNQKRDRAHPFAVPSAYKQLIRRARRARENQAMRNGTPDRVKKYFSNYRYDYW
jgi:hypothetical protein